MPSNRIDNGKDGASVPDQTLTLDVDKITSAITQEVRGQIRDLRVTFHVTLDDLEVVISGESFTHYMTILAKHAALDHIKDTSVEVINDIEVQ